MGKEIKLEIMQKKHCAIFQTRHLLEVLDSLMGCDLGNICAKTER
jgi:hypothetical protein